jgi:hypothetical protein
MDNFPRFGMYIVSRKICQPCFLEQDWNLKIINTMVLKTRLRYLCIVLITGLHPFI